jgi:hypothetical protein
MRFRRRAGISQAEMPAEEWVFRWENRPACGHACVRYLNDMASTESPLEFASGESEVRGIRVVFLAADVRPKVIGCLTRAQVS